jgi:hypothetical protein
VLGEGVEPPCQVWRRVLEAHIGQNGASVIKVRVRRVGETVGNLRIRDEEPGRQSGPGGGCSAWRCNAGGCCAGGCSRRQGGCVSQSGSAQGARLAADRCAGVEQAHTTL